MSRYATSCLRMDELLIGKQSVVGARVGGGGGGGNTTEITDVKERGNPD